MSKKHYQAIARALYRNKPFGDGKQDRRDAAADREISAAVGVWENVVADIIAVLAADNPRFDHARFIEACETGRCKGMRG